MRSYWSNRRPMRAQLLSALLLSLTAASTVHSLVFIHSSSVQIRARKSLLWGRITSSSFKIRNRNILCTIHLSLKGKRHEKKKKIWRRTSFSWGISRQLAWICYILSSFWFWKPGCFFTDVAESLILCNAFRYPVLLSSTHVGILLPSFVGQIGSSFSYHCPPFCSLFPIVNFYIDCDNEYVLYRITKSTFVQHVFVRLL